MEPNETQETTQDEATDQQGELPNLTFTPDEFERAVSHAYESGRQAGLESDPDAVLGKSSYVGVTNAIGTVVVGGTGFSINADLVTGQSGTALNIRGVRAGRNYQREVIMGSDLGDDEIATVITTLLTVLALHSDVYGEQAVAARETFAAGGSREAWLNNETGQVNESVHPSENGQAPGPVFSNVRGHDA